MTKQKYIMWHVNGERKVRFGDETVTLRWHPGREQVFSTMIATWLEQDKALMGLKDEIVFEIDGNDIKISAE